MCVWGFVQDTLRSVTVQLTPDGEWMPAAIQPATSSRPLPPRPSLQALLDTHAAPPSIAVCLFAVSLICSLFSFL